MQIGTVEQTSVKLQIAYKHKEILVLERKRNWGSRFFVADDTETTGASGTSGLVNLVVKLLVWMSKLTKSKNYLERVKRFEKLLQGAIATNRKNERPVECAPSSIRPSKESRNTTSEEMRHLVGETYQANLNTNCLKTCHSLITNQSSVKKVRSVGPFCSCFEWHKITVSSKNKMAHVFDYIFKIFKRLRSLGLMCFTWNK